MDSSFITPLFSFQGTGSDFLLRYHPDTSTDTKTPASLYSSLAEEFHLVSLERGRGSGTRPSVVNLAGPGKLSLLLPASARLGYLTTLPPESQSRFPGTLTFRRRISTVPRFRSPACGVHRRPARAGLYGGICAGVNGFGSRFLWVAWVP